MKISPHFHILNIARQAARIIPKNRQKNATKYSILAIFMQRSVCSRKGFICYLHCLQHDAHLHWLNVFA
jgi:hypothetical protein